MTTTPILTEESILTIRAALARQRRERGWTKEQQAAELGIDPVTIWRWEQGKLGDATAIMVEIILQSERQPISQAA